MNISQPCFFTTSHLNLLLYFAVAPEVISGSYTYKCDLWSLGVMAYMLLSSEIPFVGRDVKEIARKIMFTDHSFSGKRWIKVSTLGKDFVSHLLVRDVKSRPTADAALKHPWLVDGKKKLSFNSIKSFQRRHSSGSLSALASFDTHQKPSLDTKICQSIENYTTYSWIHRLALMVIAYRSTGEETNPLRQIFMSYDVDNSGTVEVDELRQAFILHDKYSKDDIDNIFLALVSHPFLLYTRNSILYLQYYLCIDSKDMNGSGKISWTEFLGATIETMKGVISEDEFLSSFEHLDKDNTGYISTSVSDVLDVFIQHALCHAYYSYLVLEFERDYRAQFTPIYT